MSERRTDDGDGDTDADVVVVGGGPSGCAAAVFTARYGLDTVVFDRGNAAFRRCAYLENYLGFPAGIGVETFTSLMHDHVAEAGAEYVADMVVSVDRPDDDERGFVVQTQDGRHVVAEYVVAAAWYDGEYLRGLDDDAMFEQHDHHGESHEHFDSSYPDDDGRTPVDGLYVAAPTGDRNAQVGIAAGQGAHVARCLLFDRRREQGFPGDVLAAHYDWLRPESEFEGEWADRDRWREWFDAQLPDDADVDDDHLADLRASYIDRAFETRRTDEEISAAESRGIRRLVETIGTERVLDTVSNEDLLDYLGERELGGIDQ